MFYTGLTTSLCIVLLLYNIALRWARFIRHRLLLRQTAVGDLDNLGKTVHKKLHVKDSSVRPGGKTSSAPALSNMIRTNNVKPLIFGQPVLDHCGPIKINTQNSISVLSAEVKTAFGGHLPLAPTREYGGVLPKTVYGSRRGVETLLRRLVLGEGHYPNIEQITGLVTGVHPDPTDTSMISKVSVRSQSGETIDIQALLAVGEHFIAKIGAWLMSSMIDCTGPSQLGLKWLKAAGYGTPAAPRDGTLPLDGLRIHFDQKLKVVTLRFKISTILADRLPIPDGFRNIATIYNCLADWTLDDQNIYAQRVDGDFVQVLCCNWAGPKPPETLDGAIEFARSMRTNRPIPDWFFQFLDMLHEVEGTMTSSYVRVPPSSYVRYHKAANLPGNWIAIGDSVMKINPADGQGCSKATIGAVTLNTLLYSINLVNSEADTLSDPFGGFSERFFKVQNDKIESFW
ncbi:hypothetical protein DXG01_013030 [Tephrocybe rancida]|nr:hypothetical protein DXG01_013030 [Tephrocybe rancida]